MSDFDPMTFDLESFLQGVTQETRFIPIYADKRALAEAQLLRDRIKSEANVGGHASIGDSSLKDELRNVLSRAENSLTNFEVRGVKGELVEKVYRDIAKKNGIGDCPADQLAQRVLEKSNGAAAEAMAQVVFLGLVFPKVGSVEDVVRMFDALGDAELVKVFSACVDASNNALTLEDVEPDFLLTSSPAPATTGL